MNVKEATVIGELDGPVGRTRSPFEFPRLRIARKLPRRRARACRGRSCWYEKRPRSGGGSDRTTQSNAGPVSGAHRAWANVPSSCRRVLPLCHRCDLWWAGTQSGPAVFNGHRCMVWRRRAPMVRAHQPIEEFEYFGFVL